MSTSSKCWRCKKTSSSLLQHKEDLYCKPCHTFVTARNHRNRVNGFNCIRTLYRRYMDEVNTARAIRKMGEQLRNYFMHLDQHQKVEAFNMLMEMYPNCHRDYWQSELYSVVLDLVFDSDN